MKTGLFIRILLCIVVMGGFLYAYMLKQNNITELRLHIPLAAKELEAILQENVRLQFEIDRFENPQHLMELQQPATIQPPQTPFAHSIITLEVP